MTTADRTYVPFEEIEIENLDVLATRADLTSQGKLSRIHIMK
jgi:hypothetical protein